MVALDFSTFGIFFISCLLFLSAIYPYIYFKHSTSYFVKGFSCSGRLRKANGALSLIRHYVPLSILRSIYYALFQPHIQYGLQIRGQNLSPNSRIIRLQKTAVRLLTFAEYNATTKSLFSLEQISCQSLIMFSSSVLD